MDPFHILDNLKSQLAQVVFCRHTGVYNVLNGAVLDKWVFVIDRWTSIVEYSVIRHIVYCCIDK